MAPTASSVMEGGGLRSASLLEWGGSFRSQGSHPAPPLSPLPFHKALGLVPGAASGAP